MGKVGCYTKRTNTRRAGSFKSTLDKAALKWDLGKSEKMERLEKYWDNGQARFKGLNWGIDQHE